MQRIITVVYTVGKYRRKKRESLEFIEMDEHQKQKNACTRNYHFISSSVCPVSQDSLQPLLSFTIPITDRCRTYEQEKEKENRMNKKTSACCIIRGPRGPSGASVESEVTWFANLASPPRRKSQQQFRYTTLLNQDVSERAIFHLFLSIPFDASIFICPSGN